MTDRAYLDETASVPNSYIKRRDPAASGSIPDRLQMFPREVRFYREVAESIGVRVPACLLAELHHDGSTYLELEDLSDWRPGASPTAGAGVLRALHSRWQARALEVWPWLPRADVSDLVEDLYAAQWSGLRDRNDLAPAARDLGDRLLGHVKAVGRDAEGAGPQTLVHGDASSNNMRTATSGLVALLDWEDFGMGTGVSDLAWFLVSSVEPRDWDAAIDAYGESAGLNRALPEAVVQALLSLSFEEEGSDEALGWIDRVTEAARRV